MDAEVALFFNRTAGDGDEYNSDGTRAGDPIGPCHSCGFDLMLRKPEGRPPYIACMGHPSCRERVQLPRATQSVSVSQDHCQDCHHGIVHKLDIRYQSADSTSWSQGQPQPADFPSTANQLAQPSTRPFVAVRCSHPSCSLSCSIHLHRPMQLSALAVKTYEDCCMCGMGATDSTLHAWLIQVSTGTVATRNALHLL